jgi:hypothetical protein
VAEKRSQVVTHFAGLSLVCIVASGRPQAL